MGVLTLYFDQSSPLPADKLFKLFVLQYDTLVPKLLPQVLKNVELISGDGGPGSIKKYNFVEGSGWNYFKHRVDALDKENRIYNCTQIECEGEANNPAIDHISYDTTITATPDGGSKSNVVIKYYPKPGAEINEEEIKEGLEKQKGVYSILQGYASENPNAL